MVLELAFPRDLPGESIDDAAAEALAAAEARGAGHELEPPSFAVRDGAVRAELVLANRDGGPVPIAVVPLGGSFPHGGESPFRIAFASAAPVRYEGELLPPEPPLPLRIVLPASSRVTFAATLDLTPWRWTGSPSVAVEWSFSFVREPRRGAAQVRLPPRSGDDRRAERQHER